MINKWKRSHGMLAFRSTENDRAPLVRFQIYWPEIVVSRTEFRITAPMTVRAVFDVDKGSYGVGFEILGFGLGVSRDR